jgi:subtilisin family serine protease
MRHFIVLILMCVTAGAVAPVDLFNGRDLAGWELVANPATDISLACQVIDGGVLAVTGRPVGYLLAAGSHENYRLHIEYRWPADAARNSNSGVLVHIASGPIDRNIWPVSYQIQMKIDRAGDLLPMAGAKFAEALSSAPEAVTPQLDHVGLVSEKALGGWNSVDVVCRGGTIQVSINGVFQNKITHCTQRTGRIGIQLEGFPFELRNLRLTPLD